MSCIQTDRHLDYISLFTLLHLDFVYFILALDFQYITIGILHDIMMSIKHNHRTVTVDHFIQLEPSTADSDPNVDQNLDATTSGLDSDEAVTRDLDAATTTTESNLTFTETLSLRNKLLPRMNLPVTIRSTDSLKQAMETLACSKSNVCFLVDDAERVTGLLTLRDIIIQFAPPCMDSRITGGRFFEDALEQSGCDVKDRTLILESNR